MKTFKKNGITLINLIIITIKTPHTSRIYVIKKSSRNGYNLKKVQ